MRQRKWKWISFAILAALTAGVSAGSAEAKDYGDQAITGSTDDAAWLTDGSTVKQEGDTVVYTLKGDNTFQGNTKVLSSSGVMGFWSGKTRVDSDGTITLKRTGEAQEGLIAIDNGADVTINGNVNASVANTSTGKVNMLSGITMSNGMQSTWDAATHLTINGNADLSVTTTGRDGYNGNGGDLYTGARWAPSGIMAAYGGGSTMNFNGSVNIYVTGIGVRTDAYYYGYVGEDGKTIAPYDANVVNLNGGNVTIKTADDKVKAQYSLGGFGGTTNVNVAYGGANTNAKDYAVGTNDVTLYGNVIAMKNDMGSKNNMFYQDSRLNIGLNTKNSSWTGVIDNTGTTQTGEVNVWLSNGANWFHTNPSKVNGMGANNMPLPSRDYYGNYDGISHVNWLQGGASARSQGYLTQTDKADLAIANYKGFATVIYDHANDGTKTTDYTAGNVKIGHAEKGSQITLSTSSKNIHMDDDNMVKNVLNALAGKLYYTGYIGENGERNLTGKVQIASGLLSTDTELVIGDVHFNKENGQGSSEKGESAENTYTSGITGNPSKDTAYADFIKDGKYVFDKNTQIVIANAGSAIGVGDRDLVIDASGKNISLVSKGMNTGLASAVSLSNGTLELTARKLDVTVDNEGGYGATGITLGSLGSSFTQKLQVNGDVNLDVTGKNMVEGLYVLGKSEAVIDGNLSVKVNNKESGYEGKDTAHYATNGIFAADGGAAVKITGNVDVATNGTGVQANKDSRVDILGGGKVIIDKNDKSVHYGINAEAATVNMNVTQDEKGNVTGAGDKTVNVTGNLGLINKNYGASPNLGETPSMINLALTNKDSTLHGVAFNEFEEQAAKKDLELAAEMPTGSPQGKINLWLSNGATWNNERWGAVKGDFTGSKVDTLIGGKDSDQTGYILQNDTGTIDIKNYRGHTVIVYGYDSDKVADGVISEFKGGNTVIQNAAAGSGIIASTSSKDIDMTKKESIEKTLTALAKKLQYTAADGNLKGQVQIASGLLSTSQALKLGDLKWDGTQGGLGEYVEGSVHDVVSIFPVNDQESYMMQGVRSAVTTSQLSFRDTASDLFDRRAAMKEGKLGEGIWAKTYGGKSRYDGAGLDTSYSYWGAQVGYDKDMENGWHAGIGLDYQDGSSDYLLDGSGDNKLYTLGVYVNKDMGDSAYFDAAVKAGHVENDFHVYNEIHEELAGRYSTNGYSASARIGKRIGGESYIEPSLQLTYAHLDGGDFTADSTLGRLYINQDDYDSLVGRVGLEIGNQNQRGGFFGKVSIAHEFMADTTATYSDGAGASKHTSFDIGDTWSELTLGGQYQMNENTRIYADLTRSLGGDYQTQWKANAGVRVFLGSGVAPGAKKAALPVQPLYQHAPSQMGNAAAAKPGQAKATPVQVASSTSAATAANHTDRSEMTVREALAGAQTPAPVYESHETAAPIAPSYSAPHPSDLPTFTLDAVVVTANRVPQPLLEARADISVVSRKEIEEMHMGTVEEVLRTVPGVQFLNYGANGLNANLSGIRLNGSKDIVVLVDGVRINDFQGVGQGGYMYASILNNMDNIERVEVLRGAAGTLYGSAAKGGVINIITRKVNGIHSMIDVSRGSFGKENYKLNTQGRYGAFSYNAYYDKTLIGDTKDGDGKTWPGHTNTESYGMKAAYDLNKKQTLTVNYDYVKSKYSGRDFVYQNDFKGDYETKSLTLRHDYKISDLWQNAFSYRHSDNKYHYGQNVYAGNEKDFATSGDFTYNFFSDQANYTSDKHTLTFGIDYSKAKDNDIDPKLGVHHTMSNVSLFAQDDWKILPSITLTGGIRHDRPENDAYGPDFESHTSYSYKISWDVTDKDTVYAGRSDYFILPSLGQLYDEEYGNTKIRPAEGRTTSIGYNRKFSDRNILTLNWFQTHTDYGIGYVDEGPNQGQYVNYTNGVSRGWNLQFTSQLSDSWSARIGWAHLFQFESGDPNFAYGYYPKDLATFGIYYKKNKWTAAFDGYYFMRKVNPNYDSKAGWPADNYGIYNLSASYSPNKNLTAYIKIENLFDTLYAEQTGGIWGKGPGTWYSLPGRSFLAGLQLKF